MAKHSLRLILGIHGFGFSASADKPDPFDVWKNNIDTRYTLLPYHWNSVPLSTRHIIGSWLRGYWNRYRRAWVYAEKHANIVRAMLSNNKHYKIDGIVAHSLGSRIVLCALNEPVEWNGVVLIFNGAEHDADARRAALMNPQVQFINVHTTSDRVLRYLGTFFSPELGFHNCIGLNGLPNEPSNWINKDFDPTKHRNMSFSRHNDAYRSDRMWILFDNVMRKR